MCYSHSFVSVTFAQTASSWTETHGSHGDTLACLRTARRIRAVVAPWPVPMPGRGAGDSGGESKLVLATDLVPFHAELSHPQRVPGVRGLECGRLRDSGQGDL